MTSLLTLMLSTHSRVGSIGEIGSGQVASLIAIESTAPLIKRETMREVGG